MGQPGNFEDPTLDMRAAHRAGRIPDDVVVGRFQPPRSGVADLPERRVSGKVCDEYGGYMSGLDIVVYHVGFRCADERLGATRTGTDGGYVVSYHRDGVVNLQVRALNSRGTEVVLSTIVYRATDNEVINLVCPANVRPPVPEYTRLLGDVSVHLGQRSLAEAMEDDKCRDITLLSRSTGWDARLVALAAHAERLQVQTGAPRNALYALLRSGLPTDATMLASVKPAALEHAWQRAIKAGVVGLTEADMAAAREALARYRREARLNRVAAPGTLSTVAELLAISGLDGEEQQRFDAIVSTHDGDPESLWHKVREAGIPEAKIRRLQTQGKLAALTLNNAPLIAALHNDIGDRPLARTMVAMDLHQPQAWVQYLSQVGAAVPPAYEGATEHERRLAYAEDLARKVRIGLPTHVIARRAETGEFKLPGAVSAAQVLYRAADEAGFRFGTAPTRTFLQHNRHLFDGIADPEATEQALVTMHRVYQITPNDQAMAALIEAGVTSAYAVTAMGKKTFVARYAERVGGPSVADLVYRKSQLVSSTVFNAFAAAQAVANAPVTYATPALSTAAQQEVAKHFPTLAGLFGELDFCECDHCGSVLSPAAYLVDLLSFVDPKDNVWELIRESGTEPKPFDVLVKRRPDLPLLPLTCENTNTVLPYIDIVNEILEFSVAHHNEPLPAFDIKGADSDDLLAEPQNLISEAYPILKSATYPIGLPFDLWLETVRAYLNQLDAPLAKVLAQLCPTSALDGVPYGWREVHREELGLSPAEYALFVAGTTNWHNLYGYPDADTARSELTRAKTLARRLGVTYQELADLVRTWFVNPDLDALALLYSLGLTPWDLMRYMNAAGVPPFDPAERTAFEEKAGTFLAWLTTEYTNGTFDHIVVLADSDTSCSFEHTIVRYLRSADQIDEVLARINLLVRLWRKLGWELSEVDALLRAFLPAGPLGPALGDALVNLAHVKTLNAEFKLGRDGRVALISLWSTMDRNRYRTLFLRPRMRPEDKAIFDDPFGAYLSNPAILLKDHLSAVQGALNLSADDIKLVLGAGFDTTVLSMATVSLLDRHRVLTKGLRLSVPDLLALKELSGIDPFASTGDTLRFVAVANAVRQAGFTVAVLNYLVRNIADPAGPLAPRRERVLGLVRSLATEIHRIRTEHAVPADALAFTDEIIGQKLPLVLPAETAATFLAMWVGTIPPDQTFFHAHLVAPVGFASAGDYALLFPPPPPPGDPDALQTWQRNRHAHLAALFLPYLQDRLIQTLICQTLAGEFDADPELMTTLLTELLRLDGGPLLPVLSQADTSGFSVSYLDGTGSTISAAHSPAGEVTAGPAGTASIRLSGFVEVPTPGPYTFAAPAGATLTLSHLPGSLTSNPMFPPVDLEAGRLYELVVTIPGSGPATFGVIGENLPLGPAGRLTSRPTATVERISSAYELIRKALLITGVLDLNLPELRHLAGHPTNFGAWDLSAPAFEPLRRLCDYVLLRRELRVLGEDLVHIFQAPPAEVFARIATLTRRPVDTVIEAAQVVGLSTTDITDERPLGKLWRLLALATALGVTPAVVASWATPAPDETVAAAVRTALKARFELAAWRATVKPISDKLRQLRRDALVRYLMHRDGFDTQEALFEYFLVDPGTEPVVQTSRLRLAISSMQTFIQRCLMNLEPEVRPEVLSATQWEWMKRYRVWEANRKIFLWPENWLEPEFRDDKSHLFQALEGELLKGDVSQDLAEDALNAYLTGLDKIARLEIVSTWLQEDDLDPAHNTLHVVGRTYNKPNEYFYRRYQHNMWTPWEPISLQIESDHVVVTVWRGRPYLFWLTFVERAQPPIGEIDISSSAEPTKMVDVQLSWAEYVNGQWSAAETSDLSRTLSAVVSTNFDRRTVFMHAARHVTEEEDQVYIYLSRGGTKHAPAKPGSIISMPIIMIDIWEEFDNKDIDKRADSITAVSALYHGFRLVGRNAPVEILSSGSTPLSPPFTWHEVRGTTYVSSGPLTVWYTSEIAESAGKVTETKSSQQVLTTGGEFSVVVPPGPVNTTGSPEIDSLVRPFFYQDHKHTFYVEPTVTENVFHEWEGWIVTEPVGPKWPFDDDRYWPEVPEIDPWGPITKDLVAPTPDPISPYAIYAIKDVRAVEDPLLAPSAVIQFGESFIGAKGAVHG